MKNLKRIVKKEEKKMKKWHFKGTICFFSLLLTSCGYSLRELYKSDEYNTPIFENNFYRLKAKEFEGAREVENRNLEYEHDYVFTSLSDAHYSGPEMTVEKKEDHSLCMSMYDKTFKYGMISKLFDGWWECGGRHERARVQIDENGFTTAFNKQCRQRPSYFMMSLQNAVGKVNAPDSRFDADKCYCDVTLHVTFYMLDNHTYTSKTYSYDINNKKNNSNDYSYFGFKLDDSIDITSCKGIGVSYTLNKIEYRNGAIIEDRTHKYNGEIIQEILDDGTTIEYSYNHALWIYEIFMADSTWH